VLASGRLLAGGACARSFWSESWVAHATLLTELAGVLRTARPAQAVEVDDGWHADRDVSVAVGRWGRLQIRVAVEEHAEGRCLVRTAARLRPSDAGVALGVIIAAVLAAAAGTAAAWGGPWTAALTVIAAAGILTRVVWQTIRAASVFTWALTRVTAEAGMLPLPVSPPASEHGRDGFHPAWASRAVLAVIALVVVVGLAVGGIAAGRRMLATTGASTQDRVVPDIATSGGVAVGIAGDVFVADTQEGLIRRLRPRPPFDASWTADDIGTDGDPVLGRTVAFDAAADIAVAPNGDLYIADARHNRVWQAERSTGRLIVIAGSGAAGFDGDGGPASS
jgi:hypothetical protein